MADLKNSKWQPQKKLIFQLHQFSIFFHEISVAYVVLVRVIFPASLNSNILLFYDIKIECTIYRLTLYRQARLAQI